LVFVALKLIFRVRLFFGTTNYLLHPDARLPRGLDLWIKVKVLGRSKREYLESWRIKKAKTQNLLGTIPRLSRAFLKLDRGMAALEEIVSRWYPYLLAGLSCLTAILVFRRTIRFYVP
jgi:hypothetical protein